MRKKHLVIIPGLSDDIKSLSLFTHFWQRRGYQIHIQPVKWRNGQEFEPKLKKMLLFIDHLLNDGTVSVIGISAGGSFAFNVFQIYKDKIDKAINICGRLRTGNPNRTFRSLDSRAQSSLAFKQSVQRFEQVEASLSESDRQRLMTITPALGDELVPPETGTIPGGHTISVYTLGHMTGIGLSLLFPGTIFKFLDKK